MKKLTVILALALALILAMGISTAFAAGDNAKYGGPYQGTDPFDNQLTDTNKPAGQGFATKGADYNTDLGVGDAAYWGNANQTGITEEGFGILRAVDGQDTHGEYKKNTNSCASCHMTHTAAGESLLFRNGVYNTCAACHDGTLGYYNVFKDPADIQAAMTSDKFYGAGGGTFGGTVGMGASVHLATGALDIKAAPGGLRIAANYADTSNEFDTDARINETWSSEFTCASCHAPHGSYSDRLLHYNPNRVGTFSAEYGGLKEYGVSLASDSVDVNNDGTNETVYYVPGSVAGFTYRDKTPWLYGEDSHGQPEWTQLHEAGGANIMEEVKANYGQAFFTDPAGVVTDLSTLTMDVAPAVVVKFNTVDVAEANGTVTKKVIDYGNAAASNVFCSACHTDYNQATRATVAQANAGVTTGKDSASILRGTWTQGFRHNITGRSAGDGEFADGSGKMSCLTCHYAHGTSGEFMLNADNSFITAGEKDVNASSALKRYVNQAVCWRCHTSSHATDLKNNDGFWNGTGDGVEIFNSAFGEEIPME